LSEAKSNFEKLAAEITSGISDHAINNGRYAYEVDGFGNSLFIDDANVPSLISLPYLGVCNKDDSIYEATRSFLLSKENEYYFSGERAQGIGSQHTPKNYVWPIAIAITAMTAKDDSDVEKALETLENNDAGTGFMHESFDVDDDVKFTREWFSWSDMTYVDLVLTSVKYSLN
jgi:meiotically up-regulated gene 157 (Mug157) protein